VEVVSYSSNAGMMLCCGEWHTCVVQANNIFPGWPTCLQLGSTRKFLDNSQSTGR